MRRYTRPPAIPRSTPMMSATQSLTSALRLNVGCISSMAPPKALAPMKTGSRPKRPVRASGKASAAKAMKWTILSLPAGAGGGWSRGQSIATVSVKEDDECQGNVEVLAHGAGVLAPHCDGKRRLILGAQNPNRNAPRIRGLGASDNAKYMCN